MKTINKIAVLAILLSLAGCVTSYHPKNFFGGYHEVQFDNNAFKVNFEAGKLTNNEKEIAYTLLRSAELTLDNGFKFFQIVDEPEWSNDANGRGFDVSFSIAEPSKSNVVVMFKERPSEYFSYNANHIYEQYKHYIK